MRKTLFYSILLWISLNWVSTAAAQSAQPGTLAAINSPSDNSVVRGTVPIVGTAVDPNFWKYEVHYAPEPNPSDQWVLIGTIHETQVISGLLETWETTIIPDGTYSLRLRDVNRTGNYAEIYVRGILVANAEPTETATPTEAPLPTATMTPAATPTFMIPTSPLAQPTATPTLARPTRSALPDIVDIGSWQQSFCLGAELMAVLVVAIGLIFALRRII
jgi:hypothetical protein